MSSPVRLQYGTPTAITCTLSALASGAKRQSAAVVNTSDLFVDAIVQLKLVFPNSSPTGAVDVFFVSSTDGTVFDGQASGTDSAYTGTISIPQPLSVTPIQAGTVYQSFVVSSVFAVLPPKWAIIVDNESGFSLAAGTALQYVGVGAQVG